MKEVKFDLVLEVHDQLDKEELADMLKKYLINNSVVSSIVQKVIGEEDAPENFSISSMKLADKKVPSKSKTKKKAKTKK
jgi:hypothetical protein|tara:strand:+ start:218 stop:454 length:237 start_codon:yes stop_codon:yes gene_type:complete